MILTIKLLQLNVVWP